MGAELKVGDLIIQRKTGTGSKASALQTVTETVLADLVQQEVGANDQTNPTATADALLRLFQKYVVLPLPGYDVQYPPNLEAYYSELLVNTPLLHHIINASQNIFFDVLCCDLTTGCRWTVD